MHEFTFIKSILALFKTRRQLVLENAFLRYQLSVSQRKNKRLILKKLDRIILPWLAKRLSNWKNLLVIIQPETLIRWHRKGFALFWTWRSGHTPVGRPEVSEEVKKLIWDLSKNNHLWGAPRIHGELRKLGIHIAPSTVQKYMSPRNYNPSQGWKNFLNNHAKELVAIDFFSVPTIHFKMLWAFLVLSHDRRKILHYEVTYKGSTSWTVQQLRETFPYEFPRFIIHDRDAKIGNLQRFGIREFVTAYRCPWQNGYVERLIGSIKRECINHFIVFGERHLSRILESYVKYYNETRTHLSLGSDPPISRPEMKEGKIIVFPQVGGLHHRYERRVAS